MSITRATDEDPRGVIAESYHIEGLDEAGAKDIFLGWALQDAPHDPGALLVSIESLLGRFQGEYPDHPMTKLLEEAQYPPIRKRSRRRNAPDA